MGHFSCYQLFPSLSLKSPRFRTKPQNKALVYMLQKQENWMPWVRSAGFGFIFEAMITLSISRDILLRDDIRYP